MPMSILFIAAMFMVLYQEIEGILKEGPSLTVDQIFKFKFSRQKPLILVFATFTALLCALEIYLFSTSQIYSGKKLHVGFSQLAVLLVASGAVLFQRFRHARRGTTLSAPYKISPFVIGIALLAYLFITFGT